MSEHRHRIRDIVGYRVVEIRSATPLASNHGTIIVEFFDGRFYPNAIDVAHQISADSKRGFAIVDRHYSCGCWSIVRNPGEHSSITETSTL